MAHVQHHAIKPQQIQSNIDWNQFLSAESKIEFNAAGDAKQFENLYGTVSKMENGQVVESKMADGSRSKANPGKDPYSESSSRE